MKKLMGAALLATAIATPAFAGDGPFYIGAEVGKDHFGVLGGYKINEMFAVEMNYNVFDDETVSVPPYITSTVEVRSLGVSAVGTFPIQPVPGLSVFGKAGFERVEFDMTTTYDYRSIGGSLTTVSASDDDIEFAGSVGAQYDVTSNFSARAGVHVKGQADSVFANAIYYF